MKFSSNTPPPVCVNNSCFSRGYWRFFKRFSEDFGRHPARWGAESYRTKERMAAGFGSESGRSLVEMLGTLAIMGILTIGGIVGFNYAMNKQRANATVNYVNQLAVLGTGQMLAGGTPKLLDYPDHTPSGYPAKITTDTTVSNAFYIEINEVPTPVCDEIISRLDGWKMVNDIGFFNGVGACADQEKVNMWFEISASANKGETDYHCQTNNDCKNRFGNNFVCNAKGTCELSCPNGTVKTPVGCCAMNKVFNGGCCRGTITEENGIKKCCIQSWSNTYCCAEGEFSHGNECRSCDSTDTSFIVESINRCAVCPTRVHDAMWGCSDKCTDPDAQLIYGRCHCPPERPIPSKELGGDLAGKCLPCDTELVGDYRNTSLLDQYDTGIYQTAHYCNHCNGGGYSYFCATGTVGVSWNETIKRKVDGEWTDFKGPNYGECVPCSEIDVSALK